MSRLSVVIIAFNESANIGRCIDSVKGLADEIVIVDSGSTDNTISIAEKMGARVIKHAFEGYVQQKNFARLQAVNDFVLSLDADESLSEALKISILNEKENFSYDGYEMNRLNFYCGEPIKTCGWYPDKKLRLWNRNKGEWTGLNPHDKFALATGTSIKHLQGDILHNTFPTKAAYLNQVDRFATIVARQVKNRSLFYLFPKMIFSPPFKFVRNYIFKLGFTEGATGFVICFQQGREVFLKYYRAIKFKMAG